MYSTAVVAALVTLLVRFFFVNDTATTEIYTLSLHDALPILLPHPSQERVPANVGHQLPQHRGALGIGDLVEVQFDGVQRSEEHTSELQSRQYLVCRLLLEKKKSRHNIWCSV